MELRPTHEIHGRRLSRNLGVALMLVALVALVFGLTVVKVTRGEPIEGFDHAIRPQLATDEVTQ